MPFILPSQDNANQKTAPAFARDTHANFGTAIHGYVVIVPGAGSCADAAKVHLAGKRRRKIPAHVPQPGNLSCTLAARFHQWGKGCRDDATPFHNRVTVSCVCAAR